MIIWGTVIALLGISLLTAVIGPYGPLVFIAVMFGIVLDTHLRTKEIQTDLQAIKEKLGLSQEEAAPVSDEEIEAELEREARGE
ncbi:hypothetical protein [Paenibacillus sp. NFR01]|uniref:hypothetical protein n=1 Tax=Paenibacillus sp. NFR01 TaxID=1566279 RepID=UPI0008CDE10C|nr:hypothetical protein [Paenibacillus sp. NFR01]SET96383.1 hypothetical protein SAMN03159358_2887 [Paenibacillus sp. NFR01]